jgi:hypothetical protein
VYLVAAGHRPAARHLPQGRESKEMTTMALKPMAMPKLEELYFAGTHTQFKLGKVANPTPLLEDSMRFIETHQGRHLQDTWMDQVSHDLGPSDAPICGTAGCLAGWGVALNNPVEGTRILDGEVVLADERYHADIPNYAAYLFGITEDQADQLFGPRWDAEQLRSGVNAIKANPAISHSELHCVMSYCDGCPTCGDSDGDEWGDYDDEG